jgi:acyl-CoA reductase-like NAD-dependent aldehyde dehydrogenase
VRYDAAFVDGDWVAVSHDTATLVDPATEEPFAELALAGPATVEAAVRAARSALAGWQTADRVAVLQKARAAIDERRAEFAAHITQDMGCPPKIADAVQVGTPLAVLDGFLGLPVGESERIEHSLVVREPVGVVGAITPWNYPLHQVVAKVAPALLSGCTVVLKPSELAPSASLLLAEVLAEAGLPAGVLNVVVGTGPVVGQALAEHPDVDMVSFTGSTRAGREVSRAAAGTIKRVALELGGKSASVVLDDLDDAGLDRAVKISVSNAFLNSGQTCTAWTRLVVPRGRHDEAAELAGTYADAMGARLGPLASRAQWDRVQGFLADAAASSDGRLVTGGEGRLDGHDRGYFAQPTVYADLPRDAPIAQEEIFGPVLSVLPHDGEEDAVAIANATPYGLAGAVWSADVDRATTVARRMRTGQVDVNGARFNPLAPFGGYGQSGNGRELGRFGLDEYLEVKSIQLP